MKEININIIKELITSSQIIWSQHILIRMSQRGMKIEDVENAISTGEIIEEYYNDYPHPSFLIMGMTVNNDKIHIVCGVNEYKIWMITAYYPSLEEWLEDLKTRRR